MVTKRGRPIYLALITASATTTEHDSASTDSSDAAVTTAAAVDVFKCRYSFKDLTSIRHDGVLIFPRLLNHLLPLHVYSAPVLMS